MPPKPLDAMVRFLSKVNKTEGCWLWTAGTFGKHYGAFRFDGSTRRAHRVSWLLHNGAIPDGLMVLHRCDTPACVNPGHLFLGTSQDNVDDRERKQRGNPPRGQTHYKTRLTKSDALAIRADKGSCGDVGRRFGISKASVSLIRNRKRWANV